MRRTFLLPLLIALASHAAADEFTGVHKCDEYAAHPDDRHRWAAGVSDEEIVPGPAVHFCRQAVSEHPDTPRFAFQLGRALWAARQFEEGTRVFLKLEEEAEYGPVYAYLADAYMYGIGGVEVDEELAVALYQLAEEEGFAPAGEVLAALANEGATGVPVSAADQAAQEPLAAERPPERVEQTAVLPKTEQQEASANATEKIDFSAYNQPRIMNAFRSGDFSALSDEFSVLLYVSSFNDFFSSTINFLDQSCSLLYRPALRKRILARVQNSVLGDGTPEQQGMRALEHGLGMLLDAQRGGPSVMLDRAADIGILKEEGEKDAARLAQTLGCQHPATERMYHNMTAFVMGAEPIVSPEVERRRQLETFRRDAHAGCVAQYKREAFCTCALNGIDEIGVGDDDWAQISRNFADAVGLGRKYTGLIEVFRSCT